MITVAAIIPVALVAGSLIGILLNARLARRRRQAELRGPQLDEFVQSAFQALRELRTRSELTAKLKNATWETPRYGNEDLSLAGSKDQDLIRTPSGPCGR